jgi:TonB family protein
VSLSLVAHVLLFLLVATWIQYSGEWFKKAPKTVWIEVDPLPKKDAKQRIVQTQAGQKTKDAPEDAFLGKQNQRVDRQTVSRTQVTQAAQASKPQSQTRPQEKTTSEQKASAGKGALSHLGLAILPKVKPGQDTQKEDPNPPRWQRHDGTVAQDYVKGIQEGDTTALNTKEYVFWGYFQRIRERLDIAWNRRLRTQLSKLWKKGRTLASDADHTTRLLVTLDPGGKITRVQILEDSGTVDLDQAAIRAFNDAGPFPNPPQGIVDAKGQIQIRWDFVLKT